MIVRIATEGQYELHGDDEETLRELDNEAVSACEAGDEQQFRQTFDRMLELVRGGERGPDDELAASEVILPPPDTSLEEAQAEFSGEGLIPG